jgi:hypothetical protein
VFGVSGASNSIDSSRAKLKEKRHQQNTHTLHKAVTTAYLLSPVQAVTTASKQAVTTAM